jgi:hypothetical protein
MKMGVRLADDFQFTTTWILLCAAEVVLIRDIEFWSSSYDLAAVQTLFVSLS